MSNEIRELMHEIDKARAARDALQARLDRIREVYAGAGSVAERFNEVGNILTEAGDD